MPPSSAHGTHTERPTIALRMDGLEKAMTKAGIHTKAGLAAHIGVDRSTVQRVLGGRTGPGEEFIAAVLAAFPKSRFEDLFAVQ